MEIAVVASVPHNLISEDVGTKEQKTEWWISALKDCFSRIPEDSRQSTAAAGVSWQQHGFVPLDKNGNILYNGKIWSNTYFDSPGVPRSGADLRGAVEQTLPFRGR